MPIATGTFTVELEAQSVSDAASDAGVGRRILRKRFSGDLQGNSSGEMLAVMTPVEGSMAYVALERFDGILAGHAGQCVFQHASLMERGAPAQSIRVVPDSGTDALTGLRGELRIDIVDGEHRYHFDYTLDA